MPNWTGGIITARGRELQAKVEAGETLVITKMKLGSGTPQAYEMDTLTDLKQPLMEFGISSKTVENNICEVTGVVVSSEIETPFYAREWGLFAQDPDEGEILYMYTTDPNPDFIPAKTAALQISATYALNIVVLNVDNIIVNIDPNGLVTTAILKNELKKYLPLSGGDMTGDITANNIYANNNVLVFNNVAEMKSSNKVKTGYTLRTLGFYTAGDGGGADYLVIDDIGEDEVDEASIIALQKELYAKLLIQDYVNAKWFGVRLDGETDDTDKFNAISEYLLRISSSLGNSIYSKSVYIPSGVLIATDTIKIDLSLANWIFDGTIVKVTHNGVAVGLISNAKGNGYDNVAYHFEGLRVTKNNDEEDVYSTGIEVNFEGSDKQGHRISSNNVYISNFNTGVNYAQNHTYADTWDKLSIENCNKCLSIKTANDSGEKIAFLNSMLYNSDEAIYLNHSTADVYFYNCSIDYNKTAINMEGDIHAFFYGCHVEWSDTEKQQIINNSNTGSINFFGGELLQTGSSSYTDFAFKNEAKSCSGINIYGTLMHNIQAPALCNNGIKLSNIRTYHLGALPNLSNNLFYDFTDKTYLPSFIYISKDNSYSISDGEIKITKFTYNAIYIIRKVNNHNRFTINFKIKSSETLPSSADILMQAYYGIKNQSDKEYSSIYFQGDIRLQSYIGTEFNSFNNTLVSIPSSENITNDYDDIYAVFKIFVLSGLTDDSGITLSLKDIKITAY